MIAMLPTQASGRDCHPAGVGCFCGPSSGGLRGLRPPATIVEPSGFIAEERFRQDGFELVAELGGFLLGLVEGSQQFLGVAVVGLSTVWGFLKSRL